ncbi:MAG: di-trans,poly-cis-decaprenylcistransferase [Candidatus Magasanikbacteria bacterium]|nr:di-trans,poly-cis-decaprenylcistransferase [Candidatus Magasanikbacteria bacterium]
MTIKHIAVIMDGNRRWATKRGMPKIMGHTQGGKNLFTIVDEAMKQDIGYITFYALSTENLKRSEEELSHLFSLFNKSVASLEKFIKNNVQLRVIGNLQLIPEEIRSKLESMIEKTKDFSHPKTILTLAVAYGGRDEIMRAIKKIMHSGINVSDINEEVVGRYLDTHDMPDVDLVIRTGGHKRLSNFLPWQTTYAEFYFTDILWPAFNKKEFISAIEWFEEQKRNKGK